MGKESAIQWTDATLNFWTGCTKVSAGCDNCYMYRDKERYGQDPTKVIRTKPITFNAALKWKEPLKIFVNSWSDFFIKDADEWRNDAWDIIRQCPQHTWQILTKRPARIEKHLPKDWGDGWENVWLGVSIENGNRYATERKIILNHVPAKTKFISFEPLIGRISNSLAEVDWIIIGGESGNDTGKYGYRECTLAWIDEIIGDYREHKPDVAIFVKQLGTHLAKKLSLSDRHGGNINEFPEHFRIREFPKERILT